MLRYDAKNKMKPLLEVKNKKTVGTALPQLGQGKETEKIHDSVSLKCKANSVKPLIHLSLFTPHHEPGVTTRPAN